MHFLYLGKDKQRAATVKAMLRSVSLFQLASTPELACFKILNENYDVVFLDFQDADYAMPAVLSNLEGLQKELEIVLITEPESLNQLSRSLLSGIFGVMLPELGVAANQVVLAQVCEKVKSKEKIAALTNSSILDGLTKLYNHAYIQQHMEEEIRLLNEQGEPLTLVLFDIDNFKTYNDTNGHPAGDRVLKKVADIMRSSFRKFDFMGRYGGEEFIVLFPGTKMDRALHVTERFRHNIITTEFEYGDLQPLGFVSASFGVATLDNEEITDKHGLLHYADQAMYKAKQSKRNCIWFYHGGQYHHF